MLYLLLPLIFLHPHAHPRVATLPSRPVPARRPCGLRSEGGFAQAGDLTLHLAAGPALTCQNRDPYGLDRVCVVCDIKEKRQMESRDVVKKWYGVRDHVYNPTKEVGNWRELNQLKSLANSTHMDPLFDAVWALIIKHMTYKRDIVDQWALPSQSLRTGRGDCEDYALLTMAALIHLKVPPERLRLVLVYDRFHREAHTVLTYRDDRGLRVFDSQVPYVVHQMPPDYLPQLSFAKDAVYTYVKDPQFEDRRCHSSQ